MNYSFPIITNISQVREAIAGCEEFIEADKGSYIVFNYLVNFEDTFPPVIKKQEWTKLIRPPESWKENWPFDYNERAAILRECRGLIFDKETGAVIGRRYHKFFNLNEKSETLNHNIDWNQGYIILEKLDGSMVTSFKINTGEILYGTKMGETDVSKNAAEFISAHIGYQDFTWNCANDNFTPIFEWCSRKNRIVVDYPEDRLVLTAMRHNETGEYVSYPVLCYLAELYGIEVVKAHALTLNDAIEKLSFIKEEEGYVIRFDDGHMLKLKGEWYLQLHKTMEHLQHEKDLIRLILDERLDDAKPFLPPDLAIKVDEFGSKLYHNIRFLSNELAWNCIEDYDYSHSKKQYAARIINKDETKIRFATFDFIDNMFDHGADEFAANVSDFVYGEFIKKIKSNLSTSTRVDSVRHLFGNITWNN